MHGTGTPLVTPFTGDGELDEARLAELVGWLEDRGIDFLVPAGSNGEAALMSADERARVVEVVVEAASVPVLAGTGHPGFRETLRATDRAADAGADGALVVTPYYYGHDQETVAAHYRDLADAVEIPIYLYSVPAKTGFRLDPETVGELAAHPNVRGMKDSTGDIEAFDRERARTEGEEFDLFVGHGSVYAHALDAGGDGGVLAVANAAPERATSIHDRHSGGDPAAARAINRDLIELNRAVTARYGVPGLKAVMRARGAPAGYPRKPFREPDADAMAELEALAEAAEP